MTCDPHLSLVAHAPTRKNVSRPRVGDEGISPYFGANLHNRHFNSLIRNYLLAFRNSSGHSSKRRSHSISLPGIAPVPGALTMATAAQIEANRRNAQKSCGPKTDAGKAKTRLNALKHGGRA